MNATYALDKAYTLQQELDRLKFAILQSNMGADAQHLREAIGNLGAVVVEAAGELDEACQILAEEVVE